MSVVLNALKESVLEGKNLFVACSGGLDSTILLHGLIELGFKPTVIHVNYHLRSDESNLDETFVKELANRFQLNLIVKNCSTRQTKAKGVNLQNEARKFRHSFFQEIIQENERNVVLLAHHQNDQIETFFLQLIRGAGIFGLGGMHVENIGIIRPFLNITKEELKAEAEKKGYKWREDSSNKKNTYYRNVFRNKIIPELTTQFPTLIQSITFLQEKFREQQADILSNLAPRFYEWKTKKCISFLQWNQLTLEEKIATCKYFTWPIWIIERIELLEKATLSSSINKTQLFRTKDGFSWEPNFVNVHCWDFKSEAVSSLPDSFNVNEIYIDADKCKFPLEFKEKSENITFKKYRAKGSTKLHKLMKDNGIPVQWRNSYPLLFCGDVLCWVPGIAITSSFLADSNSQNIIRLTIS